MRMTCKQIMKILQKDILQILIQTRCKYTRYSIDTANSVLYTGIGNTYKPIFPLRHGAAMLCFYPLTLTLRMARRSPGSFILMFFNAGMFKIFVLDAAFKSCIF